MERIVVMYVVHVAHEFFEILLPKSLIPAEGQLVRIGNLSKMCTKLVE